MMMQVNSVLTFRKSVVQLIKAGKLPLEETFIFAICPLEISTNALSNFGR